MSCSTSRTVIPEDADGGYLLHQIDALGRVHPSGRLVEHQEAGFRGERPGYLDQTALTVRQTGGRPIALLVQPHQREHLHGRLPRATLLCPLATEAQTARPEAGPFVPVAPREDVLEHAHVLEDAQVLESPGHPLARGVSRSEHDQIRLAQRYPAGGQRLLPAYGVEERRLACPVRPDESSDAALERRRTTLRPTPSDHRTSPTDPRCAAMEARFGLPVPGVRQPSAVPLVTSQPSASLQRLLSPGLRSFVTMLFLREVQTRRGVRPNKPQDPRRKKEEQQDHDAG